MMIEGANKISKDGLWGWLVCMSCFFGNLLLGGIKRSFGLALPVMKSYFNTSTTTLSWVASILEGMYYVVGPLASFVSNRIGLGLTSIIGSFLTSIGLSMSTFIPNIYLMMLTYSIICGLGLGFIYLPASVACNYHFEKRIGLATGISKTGYSIGGIIFPLLAHSLIITSGWKAMFYMFTCTALLNCGFGVILKLSTPSKSGIPYKEIEDNETVDANRDIVDNEKLVSKGELYDPLKDNKSSSEIKPFSLQNKVH